MEDDRIFLDTSRAELPMWLLKCPLTMSRAFQSVASNSSVARSPVIAKIVHTIDLLHLDDPSSEQFTLEMIRTDPNTPRSYRLNMSKEFAPLCVFYKSKQGKLSVEGKVECKFDMEPLNSRAYSKFCCERMNTTMVRTRKVQAFKDDHGMYMSPMPGIVVSQLPSSSKMFRQEEEKKKITPSKGEKRKITLSEGQHNKRVRRDNGEILNILFRLFERQPNWGLKQLVRQTDQTEQFLKEILSEICVYNKRGPNRGTHQLKVEYKNQQ